MTKQKFIEILKTIPAPIDKDSVGFQNEFMKKAFEASINYIIEKLEEIKIEE